MVCASYQILPPLKSALTLYVVFEAYCLFILKSLSRDLSCCLSKAMIKAHDCDFSDGEKIIILFSLLKNNPGVIFPALP